MNCTRIAAVLALLWAAAQFWFLRTISVYLSGPHLVGWGLTALFLSISVGLWQGWVWVRAATVVISAAFLVLYAAVWFLHGNSCAQLPLLCYLGLFAQPILILAMLLILAAPMAADFRWRGP